jgi:hypothetical protein
MNKTFALIAAAAFLMAAGAGAQPTATPPPAPAPAATGVGTPMRPGMWETTTTVQTVGGESRRTIVSRACYAAADVGDAARVLPRHLERGMKCENRDVRPQAGKASWQVACASADGTLTGPAEVTFAETTYAGKADLERRKKGAKAEKVSTTLSGKWLEACK